MYLLITTDFDKNGCECLTQVGVCGEGVRCGQGQTAVRWTLKQCDQAGHMASHYYRKIHENKQYYQYINVLQ